MDYTTPITTTVHNHIANIKLILDDLAKNYTIDLLLENLDIIEECKRTLDILKTKPCGATYTLCYYDGLDYFEITEG